MGGISAGMAMLHLVSNESSLSRLVPSRKFSFDLPLRVYKPPYGWTDIPPHDVWAKWARADQQRDITEQPSR